MKRLEVFIKEHAREHPKKVAVVSGGVATTYGELCERISVQVKKLCHEGVSSGMVVPFRNTQDLSFLITYFALHEIGAVALPLESDVSDKQFHDIADHYSSFTPPEGVADILFTTGTTGKSKGVMVSHATILADAENLIVAHGYSTGHLFIINGPLNHIGSLSKVYPVMLLGGTLYLLEGMKDLNAFFQALDYPCDKVATFLVPTSARILLQLASQRLSSYREKIDFIETGAAPMSHADMLSLCQLLPHSRLFNTYASTETGIICTYDFNDGRCLSGCLGKPMKNSSVSITPDGQVACSGKTIMAGYAGDEALTQTVLRDGVIYTADNGYIDNEGMLHLTGRNDDVINVGGYKISPSEVENVALGHPNVKDCICIGVSSPLTGSALKLLYVTHDGKELDKREIARFIYARLERYKVPQYYECVAEVKRTYNGKLDRKWYYE
ncbi:MAG: acyl--CoA ligase [Prevotella sp.]|nr:acyl--CoA ligase [Prevotella sp.]